MKLVLFTECWTHRPPDMVEPIFSALRPKVQFEKQTLLGLIYVIVTPQAEEDGRSLSPEGVCVLPMITCCQRCRALNWT